MTIDLNKNTKIMLAIAGVVVAGLYLWSRSGTKKSLVGLPGLERSGDYYVNIPGIGNFYVPPGAGHPFQSASGNWFYCPSGNMRKCDEELVFIGSGSIGPSNPI